MIISNNRGRFVSLAHVRLCRLVGIPVAKAYIFPLSARHVLYLANNIPNAVGGHKIYALMCTYILEVPDTPTNVTLVRRIQEAGPWFISSLEVTVTILSFNHVVMPAIAVHVSFTHKRD